MWTRPHRRVAEREAPSSCRGRFAQLVTVAVGAMFAAFASVGAGAIIHLLGHVTDRDGPTPSQSPASPTLAV